MASEDRSLEQKLEELRLQEREIEEEKAGNEANNIKDSDEAKQRVEEFYEVPEAASETPKNTDAGKPSREVQIANQEVEKSPDVGAYSVSTVDHRSYVQGQGEKKEDIKAAMVHQNADLKGDQLGKAGILHSVAGKISQSVQSVKNVLSRITGSKSSKDLGNKSEGP